MFARSLGATSDCAQRKTLHDVLPRRDRRRSVSLRVVDERSPFQVSCVQVGPFETALNKCGMAQVNETQVSLRKAALQEEGMAAIGSAQVGPNEATPPKSGMAEIPSAEVALVQDGLVEEDFS